MAAPADSILSATARALADHRRGLSGVRLDALFAADASRFDSLSFRWGDWLVDLSKERWTPKTVALLLAYARDSNLDAWIRALLSGEKVNLSERRPALHSALRRSGDAPLLIDGQDIIPAIRRVQAQIKLLAADLRAGRFTGATGQPIRTVINIGIGGSDLGPLLVCDALGSPRRHGCDHDHRVDVAFVSNIDPAHLSRTLAPLDPATTLFIVTSKTFTTQETLANATGAKAWLAAALGDDADPSRHFIAVTTNTAAAQAFGVRPECVLPLWDWVGGRYSLWSAVGLPIAAGLGWDAFAELLAGAADLDEHFRTTPLERNLPVLLGLLGYWNARHVGHPDRVVIPYSQALARLPAYLQQLILESNGKRVDRTGDPVVGPTTPAVWGEPGTNAQHAFFQWLHQGTREAPVDFIVPMRAMHPLAQHQSLQQSLLVANALAQSQALLVGRSAAAVRAELAAKNEVKGTADASDAAIAARVCPGDRASTTILMPRLDARNLGALLALYEHRTFVEATLFGINPFDQWGVELGKTLAGPISGALLRGEPLPEGADASTRGLVAHVRSLG